MLLRLVLGVPLVVGCGGSKNVRDVVGQPLSQPEGARIALADPVFLHSTLELEGSGEARDLNQWRANTWVGRIWFSGGYEILPEEGNQVRSVELELSDADEMGKLAREWVEQAAPAALTEAGYTVVAPVGPISVSAPEQRFVRGTVAFDGKDNVNLPRFDLVPGAPLAPGVETEADGIFVPVVVNYYAHNAGWFVGQEDGVWAGARMRVFWSLVAPDDGAVLGWGEVATTTKVDRMASPNRQQQQDLLLTVEAEAKALLARQLRTR
ncbi:MAG: hypothetical protein AAF602_33125 [Myxococcota bacterium]